LKDGELTPGGELSFAFLRVDASRSIPSEVTSGCMIVPRCSRDKELIKQPAVFLNFVASFPSLHFCCAKSLDSMSSSPPSTTSDSIQPTRERLDVPVLPPSGSRFVLPPPPSDLLNRLQAFLPQIKSANEQLEQQQQDTNVEAEEEAVVMEELSSDSDEEETSSDEDSSDESEVGDEEKEEGEEAEETTMQDETEPGTMDRLMDIKSRPKVVKKNLVVVESEGIEKEDTMSEK